LWMSAEASVEAIVELYDMLYIEWTLYVGLLLAVQLKFMV